MQATCAARLAMAALLGAQLAYGAAQDEVREGERIRAILGDYRRLPVENPWHEGTITLQDGAPGAALRWTNRAGVSWDLTPDLEKGVVLTGTSNPYYEAGAREFELDIRDGEVVGFWFNREHYVREGAEVVHQLSDGLHTYIIASLPEAPAEFGYGVSFYTRVWPLLEAPLAGFQIGLPSTWIIPENRTFMEPLCPPGTVARDNWDERGPYYRDVFQTIEGGPGFWVSTQFPSAVPKYRLNGVPSGYNFEVSSPGGWGFGDTAPMRDDQVGIAQLSNRVIIPPDGLTFVGPLDDTFLGYAWMALPLTPPKPTEVGPTGDQSWTLFLATRTFQGPVAFFVPEAWSRLSRTYPTINGRGLDARPGLMGGGGMEVAAVPQFRAEDAGGRTYSKIPRLLFPVDGDGRTILLQDVTLYSKEALYQSVASWVDGGDIPEGTIGETGAYHSPLTTGPPTYRQAGQPISGVERVVEPEILTEGGSYAFALHWMEPDHQGVFPEYFREEDGAMVPVPPADVPAETELAQQRFRPASNDGRSYTSPADAGTRWTAPGPTRGPFTAVLADGSEITYSWYRFADQPSLQTQGWTQAEKERVQALVEAMHRTWPTDRPYLPPPTHGSLVELDGALLLTPPEGLEVGYVPIVTSQRAVAP
ncbi:MAG: hypothetical protein FJX74_15550 [Armatimonadetes bacterium]|nr:hypothetical protein [Armatimonadota bacterium]